MKFVVLTRKIILGLSLWGSLVYQLFISPWNTKRLLWPSRSLRGPKSYFIINWFSSLWVSLNNTMVFVTLTNITVSKERRKRIHVDNYNQVPEWMIQELSHRTRPVWLAWTTWWDINWSDAEGTHIHCVGCHILLHFSMQYKQQFVPYQYGAIFVSKVHCLQYELQRPSTQHI